MVLCVLLLVAVCVNGKASTMGPACTRHGMAGAIGEEAGDGESQQRLFSLAFLASSTVQEEFPSLGSEPKVRPQTLSHLLRTICSSWLDSNKCQNQVWTAGAQDFGIRIGNPDGTGDWLRLCPKLLRRSESIPLKSEILVLA